MNIFRIILFFLVSFTCNFKLIKAKTITDFSGLTKTEVSCVRTPGSVEELCNIVKTSFGPVSVAGGRFSQGGQIAYPGGTVIDMKNFNKVIAFDLSKKCITVQSGMTWYEVQQYIDPYNLSIKTMQSYNDFSVGGSLSVNVHGREMRYGQLIETVESIKILLANGEIITASRSQNSDLFRASIGGYGLVGIIIEATLSLTENIRLKRHTEEMLIHQYPDYFFNQIKTDSSVIFHNAQLYPDDLYKVGSVTFYETLQPVNIKQRLQKRVLFDIKYAIEEMLAKYLPFLKLFRPSMEINSLINKQDEVVWRNYEMSYTVRSLEPLTRAISTSILQEYFVPVGQLIPFIDKLRATLKEHKFKLLNASIRHVPANTESLLTYAPQESFALVLYINVFTSSKDIEKAKIWTRELIDHALSVGGTYYLPYHLYGTQEQFQESYPNWDAFMKIKKKYDPDCRLNNNLFKQYGETHV